MDQLQPDGTAHLMALPFDDTVSENAMAITSSSDGGEHWSAPVIIKKSPAQDPVLRSLFHDKNTLTADPFDPDLVYATWTLFRTGVTSLMVTRSTDGGRRWEPLRKVGNFSSAIPGTATSFRQGGQIVVLPDGTLVSVFYRILFNQVTLQQTFEQAIFRSHDQARHWQRVDTTVSTFQPANAVDPEIASPDDLIPVRDAGELPDIAVNGTSGELYVTWQDGDTNGTGSPGIFVARSDDGGETWSSPVRANQKVAVQAFLPAVAVNDGGTVGVLYYDFRNDELGDDTLDTDVFLALFDSDLSFIEERQLTGASFDMRQMVLTGERGYFPGDYVGLDTDGEDFVAAFTVANNLGLPVGWPQDNNGVFVDAHNRQGIVFARETP